MTNQDIKEGAPSGATHYSDVDNDIVFYQVTNNILYWDSDYNIWDEVYFDLPDIKPIEKCKISHVTINHDRILELYDFIAHGSNDHKNWLRKALFAFF